MTPAPDLPEGWIRHDGGACPVDPNMRIIARFGREAMEGEFEGRARNFNWANVIAFRPTDLSEGPTPA